MTSYLFATVVVALVFGGSTDAAFWSPCYGVGSATINSIEVSGICKSNADACQVPKNSNVTMIVTFTPSSGISANTQLLGVMVAFKQSAPFTSFPLENSVGSSNDFFGKQLTAGSVITFNKVYPTGPESASYTVSSLLGAAPNKVIACANIVVQVV